MDNTSFARLISGRSIKSNENENYSKSGAKTFSRGIQENS